MAWLAFGAKDRPDGPGEVYAIDTWQGTPGEEGHVRLLEGYNEDDLYNEFLSNVERLSLDNVVPIRATTRDASTSWNKDISVLSIDACHNYMDVRDDFERWFPWVAPGGLIVFDDVPSWFGPSRLVSELPRWWRFVGVGPQKWVVQKLGE